MWLFKDRGSWSHFVINFIYSVKNCLIKLLKCPSHVSEAGISKYTKCWNWSVFSCLAWKLTVRSFSVKMSWSQLNWLYSHWTTTVLITQFERRWRRRRRRRVCGHSSNMAVFLIFRSSKSASSSLLLRFKGEKSDLFCFKIIRKCLSVPINSGSDLFNKDTVRFCFWLTGIDSESRVWSSLAGLKQLVLF